MPGDPLRIEMRHYRVPRKVLFIGALALTSVLFLAAQAHQSAVPVKMTVTLDLMGEGKRLPEVNREDVMVKQGRTRLKVTDWTAARGDQARLDLFVLIDDASDPSLGSQLGDLSTFIKAQPSATSVGVGCVQNAAVQIAQDFTKDHAAAAKALRLPFGSPGAYGSPYVSVVDLMKRWPENSNRREAVMTTDGIDRYRGDPYFRGLGQISPDVDYASTVAQRTGTIIHTIYSPGVGRLRHNFWKVNNGLDGIAKLSDESGGESYFLGIEPAVSLKPYLDQIQKILENRYLLTFEATQRKKAGLQPVTLTTEVAGVEFASADSVWVPATK
jgi:hypothetical protein